MQIFLEFFLPWIKGENSKNIDKNSGWLQVKILFIILKVGARGI